MGIFRRGSHAFRRSSLSNSVPLDGSDTVIGLRQWDRQRRSSDMNTYLARNLEGLQDVGRKGYKQYKGPYLDQLRYPHDLKTPPVQWVIALCGGDRSHWGCAYNVPEHAAMLQERLEENVVRYRGNYLRMAALVALLVIVLRPWAVVGLACSVMLTYLNLNYPAASTSLFSAFSPEGGATSTSPFGDDKAQAQRGFDYMATLRTAAVVVLYAIIFYSRCFSMLPRCVFAACLVIFTHAALRRARSEYRALTKQDLAAQAANHQMDLLRLEADMLRRTPRPGVLFSEVFPRKYHNGDHVTDASHGGEVEDPRRVFREIWGGSKQMGGFAVGLASHWLQYTYHDLTERARSWRIPLHI